MGWRIETLDVPQTESQARRKLLLRRRLRKPLMKLRQPSPLLLRQPAALNSVCRFHRLTWVR